MEFGGDGRLIWGFLDQRGTLGGFFASVLWLPGYCGSEASHAEALSAVNAAKEGKIEPRNTRRTRMVGGTGGNGVMLCNFSITSVDSCRFFWRWSRVICRCVQNAGARCCVVGFRLWNDCDPRCPAACVDGAAEQAPLLNE